MARGLDLVLVRHGEPGDTRPGTFLGRTDPDLGEHGRQQAQVLADFLPGEIPVEQVHGIWASTLKRARQTADPIATAYDLPVVHDERLQEIDFQRWDGLVHAEIEECEPGAAQQWFADPVNVRPGGGETFIDVQARSMAWLDEITAEQPVGTVIMVAHFGVCCVLAATLLGSTLADADRLTLQRGQCARIHRGVLCWWGLPLFKPGNRQAYGDRRAF